MLVIYRHVLKIQTRFLKHMTLNVSNKKALYHFLQPQCNTKKVIKR